MKIVDEIPLTQKLIETFFRVKMEFFDLSDTDNVLVKKYSDYGKVNGLLLAHKLGLPVSKYGWVYSSSLDLPISFLDIDKHNKLLCRPDAPMGQGNRFPRGRDLYYFEIPSFFQEILKITNDAILLVFPNPSIQLTGKFIPRYQISGGLMIIIDQNQNELLIEYVGKGFDVGDITRGRHVHTSISLQLNSLNISEASLFWLNSKNLIGRRSDITLETYKTARLNRIYDLNTQLEIPSNDFDKQIPIEKATLTLPIFKKLLRKCVYPVYFSDKSKDLYGIYGIMVNLYSYYFYVFELWRPIRNIEK